MRAWHPRRPARDGPNFLADVEAMGGDMWWAWESFRPKVEQILCGVSMARLDAEYPANASGLRSFTTDWADGFPPAQIAFLVEGEPPDDAIIYLAARRTDL